MKTLKQIQAENRKFIIMANNPTAKTYDEALEMELGKDCQIKYKDSILFYFGQNDFEFDLYKTQNDFKGLLRTQYSPQKNECKIIGKPLTLNRVLIAFGRKSLDLWKNLTKETLEEHSEETQREINKLLNNKLFN